MAFAKTAMWHFHALMCSALIWDALALPTKKTSSQLMRSASSTVEVQGNSEIRLLEKAATVEIPPSGNLAEYAHSELAQSAQQNSFAEMKDDETAAIVQSSFDLVPESLVDEGYHAPTTLFDLTAFALQHPHGIRHNGLNLTDYIEGDAKPHSLCQISELSCSLLHKAASAPTNRRILEVGALFGCSTGCIASGIAASRNGASFISADLFLESVKEFEGYFSGLCGSMEKPITCEPHGETLYALENGGFRKFYDRHLNNFNLTKVVTPIKGDFKQSVPKDAYDMIYLDVTHSHMEIERNLPYVMENFVQDGTLIVFDDINNQKTGVKDLHSLMKCREGAFVGTLYVCVVEI